MLLQFRTKNNLSFKGDSILDLTSTNQTELMGNTLIYKNERLLKSAVIYGANASGKTNFIKAMIYSKLFILDSMSNKSDYNLYYSPFFESKKPTEIEWIFSIDEIEYRYGYIYDKTKIIDEWLYTTVNRETLIFRRKEGYINPNQIKNKKADIFNAVNKNTLLLSYMSNLKGNISNAIYIFFEKIALFGPVGYSNSDAIALTAKNILELKNKKSKTYKAIYELFIKELNNFGFFVTDIKIEEIKDSSLQVNYIVLIKTKFHKSFYNLYDEGSGNIKLFYTVMLLMATALDDGILIADEFDQNFHPILTRKIMNYIHKKESNGQFIFTMHDTNILKNDIMRRDQVYLVELNEKAESTLCSLSDFEIRNTQAYEKMYLEGIFGAIPKFLDEV